MNVFTRGIKNAFRNGIRSVAIVIILGLSIGLSLTMLVANKAVTNKIASAKSSIGNTVVISPAGFNSGSQANNALTTSQLSKVASLTHVSSINETLSDRLPTTGSSLPSFGGFGGSNSGSNSTTTSTTSLTSPVTLNSNGRGARFFAGGDNNNTSASFSLPISFLGTTDPSSIEGSNILISTGNTINGSVDNNDALISSNMASKNNLKVGSTFTAYNATLTVAGIFSTTTQGAEGTVVVSLPTLQRLSGQSNDVTSATVTVDSVDNLSSTTTAIKNSLGSSADVTNSQDQVNQEVEPLNSVKTVSLFSLIGAVVAGAIIILLVMVMVVRERKREIGVLKAIGGSSLRIMSEFMIEALTLTILGAVVGLLIGVIGGQPVTKLLVNNSANSNIQTTSARPGDRIFGGAGSTSSPAAPADGGFARGFRTNGTVRGLNNIKTQIGWGILLDGFGAAIVIALLGSALSAGLISKVRPSEVLRSA